MPVVLCGQLIDLNHNVFYDGLYFAMHPSYITILNIRSICMPNITQSIIETDAEGLLTETYEY